MNDSPSTRRSTNPAIRNFPRAMSMVEILSVMSIIAILIALSVPSLLSIRSRAVSNGASEVARSLSLARNMALAHRDHAGVVFSTGDATNAVIQSLVSYTILTRSNASTWIYADRWHHLPHGAFFSQHPISTGSIPFPTNGTSMKDLPFIRFNARGEAIAGDSYVVTEGFVENGSIVRSNAFNSITGIVYQLTGRVKVGP